MSNDVSVNFILEGTKPNKKNEYPIKLNIYQREAGQKRYGIKENISKEDWARLDNPKLRDKRLQALKDRLTAIETKVKKTVDKLKPFSFVAFEESYYSKSASGEKSVSLKHWFDKYIQQLKANDQIGTAISYQTTINSIQEFKKNLSLYDITPAFLQAYENHLLTAGKSVSTVGIYMRQLRAIINQAINDKVLSADMYPFKKYQVPAGRNIKKALSSDDLKKLLSHTPSNDAQKKALDFWILSYLCNGMNFTDIAHLTKDNLHGTYLYFFRQKTKRTKKKDLRPIKVGLNPKAIEIINSRRNEDVASPYLFPILEPNLSAVTVKHRCQRFIKWVNKHMEQIRQDLEIQPEIGTYAARHTFSTVMKRKGVSTAFIKEALGHSSELTTENYLDSFTDDIKMQYADLLTQL